jgi:hypothetical protein
MLNDKCRNEKVPSRLLTWDFSQSKDLPLASALLRSKVSVGNNADYIEIEPHKILPIHLCQDFHI